MRLNFTPGPWTAEVEVDENGFEQSKLWILMRGQPCGYGFDRAEDARLAAAAPDLYAVAAQVVETFRDPLTDGGCKVCGFPHPCRGEDRTCVVGMARAALAKAESPSPDAPSVPR